ncbi:FAD-dependent oxidoreductase [Thermopirellula anaerolimosa]
MIRLTIDGQAVEVPPGTTVLQAAQKLGIDIPTLCYMEGLPVQTSCLVCMVKVREPNGREKFVPSCGTPAAPGMTVESETDEVAAMRRTSLELLLSDHVGDCLAPCQFACPAHMDIPDMLRQIQAGRFDEAVVTIKEDIALPAVLGRVCPKPCEKGCRRGSADGAVSVCDLKRVVADWDLAREDFYIPPCEPASGKRVAVVGAGPTGLSAAYYLRRRGHAVVLYDRQPRPGGRLRGESGEIDPADLPEEILDREIAAVLALGIEFRGEAVLGPSAASSGVTLSALQDEYDAVLLCIGEQSAEVWRSLGLSTGPRGAAVERGTFRTSLPGVFAAGNAIRGRGLVVRSCADGKEAAYALDRFLKEGAAAPWPETFSVRIGKLSPDELAELRSLAADAPREELKASIDALDLHATAAQAGRCLHCDCRALPGCRLRRYAERYGADPNRYKGERAVLRLQYKDSNVLYEPGKCIVCGLCVAVTEAARAPLGLTFVGRGFDVRVGVPFHRSLEEALGKLAEQCVAVCPTGALSFREGKTPASLPILRIS